MDSNSFKTTHAKATIYILLSYSQLILNVSNSVLYSLMYYYWHGFTVVTAFGCSSSQYELDIIRYYGSNAGQESLSIYQFNQPIVTMSYSYSQVQRDIICVYKNVVYYAVLRDSGNNGWSYGSYFDVMYKNQYLLQEGRLVYGNYGTLAFELTDDIISAYTMLQIKNVALLIVIVVIIIVGLISIISALCKKKKNEIKPVSVVSVLCLYFQQIYRKDSNDRQ